MKGRGVDLVGGRRKQARCEVSEVCEERGLVARAKSGCSKAFGQLYERHRMRVYRTTLRVLRQTQDAEDAMQRSFQRAFTSLTRFRGDSTFATWVTRIAINEALMLLRQRRTGRLLSETRQEDMESPFVRSLADGRPGPEQVLATNERRAAVREAISHLRQHLRAVAVLRELEGLTNKEIARRLGLTLAAVKSRVFHARRWLQRRLKAKLKPELPMSRAGRDVVKRHYGVAPSARKRRKKRGKR
jgi:RNA polymerase sigma-70 factor, ECF subfamily